LSNCINNFDKFGVNSESGLSHRYLTADQPFNIAESNCRNFGGSLALGRDVVEFDTMMLNHYSHPTGMIKL
jgi:hypothetical protein